MAPLSVFKPDDDSEIQRLRERMHNAQGLLQQHTWRLEAIEARLDEANDQDVRVNFAKITAQLETLASRIARVEAVIYSFIGVMVLAVIGAWLRLVIINN